MRASNVGTFKCKSIITILTCLLLSSTAGGLLWYMVLLCIFDLKKISKQLWLFIVGEITFSGRFPKIHWHSNWLAKFLRLPWNTCVTSFRLKHLNYILIWEIYCTYIMIYDIPNLGISSLGLILMTCLFFKVFFLLYKTVLFVCSYNFIFI